MRQDTDEEKETDRVKQLVLVRKKKKNSHTHARARPNTHTHTHDLDWKKEILRTACRLVTAGSHHRGEPRSRSEACRADTPTHLPVVGGGVGEEGHVGGELAPEPENPKKKKN